jgi:hypothetical protein
MVLLQNLAISNDCSFPPLTTFQLVQLRRFMIPCFFLSLFLLLAITKYLSNILFKLLPVDAMSCRELLAMERLSTLHANTDIRYAYIQE